MYVDMAWKKHSSRILQSTLDYIKLNNTSDNTLEVLKSILLCLIRSIVCNYVVDTDALTREHNYMNVLKISHNTLILVNTEITVGL